MVTVLPPYRPSLGLDGTLGRSLSGNRRVPGTHCSKVKGFALQSTGLSPGGRKHLNVAVCPCGILTALPSEPFHLANDIRSQSASLGCFLQTAGSNHPSGRWRDASWAGEGGRD